MFEKLSTFLRSLLVDIRNKVNTPRSIEPLVPPPTEHSVPAAPILTVIPSPQAFNAAGLQLLTSFEGCRLLAYKDIGGVWTIGYGHTGPEVVFGLKISQQQAEEYLRADLSKFEAGIKKLVKVPLTDNEYSALVCLVYNIGLGAFEASTLLRRLNDSKYEDAANQFLRWNKDNGVVVAGLHRRRQAERELFLGKGI